MSHRNTGERGFSHYEQKSTYYYHPDHLGSSNYITDHEGEVYEHIEYMPYGETWIDEVSNKNIIDYKFTGKELDTETGLYYFGARYLDPQLSRWISTDPAIQDYMPEAPVDDEAKERNEDLPGNGGVFNPLNLATYHYAGNNPLKYTDPDGEVAATAALIVGGSGILAVLANPEAQEKVSEGVYQGLVELNQVMQPINEKVEEKLNDMIGGNTKEDRKAETLKVDLNEEGRKAGVNFNGSGGSDGDGPDGDEFRKMADKYGKGVIITLALARLGYEGSKIHSDYKKLSELSSEEKAEIRESEETPFRYKLILHWLDMLE